MYDSVTFWISRCDVGDGVFEGLRFFMKEGKDVGFMGNIRIEYVKDRHNPTSPPHTARVSGSIPKWINGSNVTAPTFAEVCHQIDQICGMLQISPNEARVTGLEFGSSYHVSQPPVRYNELLWAYPKSERNTHNKYKDVQTINFQSLAKKNPTFCHTFYDKGAEVLKKDGVKLDGNILRYELKYLRSLGRQLKWSSKEAITLHTLQDPRFYTLLIDKYITTFERITKLVEMNGNYKIKTSGDGVSRFLSQLANEQLKGDPNALKRFVEQVKAHNPNLSAQELSRMRSKIRSALNSSSSSDNLMSELEQLIRAECERCAPP